MNGVALTGWKLRCVAAVIGSVTTVCVPAGDSEALAQSVDRTPNYNVGVYYFPGWKDNEPGAPAKQPWKRLQDYPEREPLLGWYREGDVGVAEKHIQWMYEHGIDFVAYDWYWSEARRPYLHHAVRAYLRASNKSLVKFSLLWANHEKVPGDLLQFTSMISYWIDNYFPESQYLKIEGKPVVFIFSQQNLRDHAAKFGKTTAELFAIAQGMARDAGYPGIYFVGSAEAVNYWVKDYGPRNGYDAFSAYNYHRGFSGTYIPVKPLAHSYQDLDAAYRQSWDWILSNSSKPYIVPITSGWDKRPWGGSTDPWHDDCVSDPVQFRAHLMAAKERIDQFKFKTLGMTVICCWNEFGEGSYVEPTKKWGFRYLEQIREVFGAR